MSAEGVTRITIRADRGRLTRTARFKVRSAPLAWLVGLGLVGFGLGGAVGAGVALMLPASAVFIFALFFPGDVLTRRGRPRRKKTLRHRYYLWLDQQRRKFERKKEERRERRQAERDFLKRRRQREC